MRALLALSLLAVATCLNVASTTIRKSQLDVAFAAWRKKQVSTARVWTQMEANALQVVSENEIMQKMVNELAHPDVPLRIVFEGVPKKAVLKGDATTNALQHLACKLHGLEANQNLRFMVNGVSVTPGIPIRETSLANTENLDVHVMSAEAIKVRRSASAVSGGSWWSGAAPPQGHRGAAATRAADHPPPRSDPQGHVRRGDPCDFVP